jgi:U4/U6.U5 tri-snRNP component SNU23
MYTKFKYIQQEEKQKAYKKEKRKERKRKAEPDSSDGPSDMASVMGFSGFGTSKK